MTVEAEHALRTLAEELDNVAAEMPPGQGFQVMKAMAAAHHKTVDRMANERQAREAKARDNPSGFRYDAKGKAK